MVIRRRLGGAICLLPYFIMLINGIIFQKQLVIDLSFLLGFFGILFSERIYNLLLLNSNSTSAFYAGNLALQFGYSPKGQNGLIWNPQKYKISDIYSFYPNNRYKIPVEGTTGFLFYIKFNKNYANQIEFYDYRLGGESFIYYEFYFHSYDKNGDKTTRKERRIDEISEEMYFVPLDKL